jgi:hypothetical protein
VLIIQYNILHSAEQLMCSWYSIIYCIPLNSWCAFRIWKVIWFMLRFSQTRSTNHKFKWWRLSELWCFSVGQITWNQPWTVWVAETEHFALFTRSSHARSQSVVWEVLDRRDIFHSPTAMLHYAPEFFRALESMTGIPPSPNQRAKSDPSWKWC